MLDKLLPDAICANDIGKAAGRMHAFATGVSAEVWNHAVKAACGSASRHKLMYAPSLYPVDIGALWLFGLDRLLYAARSGKLDGPS